MRTLIALVCACIAQVAAAQSPLGRERTSLDKGWRFALGHGADAKKDFGFGTGIGMAKAGEAAGAAGESFDDAAWRAVDVPHDWAVELDFVQDPDPDHVTHGSKPIGRRFPETTIGWYRKRFDVPAADRGRRMRIELDGVFRDCRVWLNGHLVARNESGYIGFGFDATDYLNYGGSNTLAVRVDASEYEGWFYEGAGIYRHVWLVKADPVHVAWSGGVQFLGNLAPELTTAAPVVYAEVSNESPTSQSVFVECCLRDAADRIVATGFANSQTIDPRRSASYAVRMSLSDPKLWSPDEPNLYRLVTHVRAGEVILDEDSTSVGFRNAVFDKDRGLLLNGKPVKVKGVCCHQDHAGVGSAVPDVIQYFRIAKLKEMGTNGYRTSHHAPTPELLDACDELGMLVLDENRLIGSSDEVISQLERLVRRDRNHPCVIAWSIGNEEPEQNSPRGGAIARSMVQAVHALDPSRPTTYAGNNGGGYDGINREVDVRGFNYFMDSIGPYHAAHPEQPLWGSETASAWYTRGVYEKDAQRGYVSAYDTNRPGYGATAAECSACT